MTTHDTRPALDAVATWFADQVNRDVERIGIIGGRVRPIGHGRADVRWTWPSGNLRHLVTIDVDPRDGATFLVRSYDDDEYNEPHLEHYAATPHDAATAVVTARRNADAVASAVARAQREAAAAYSAHRQEARQPVPFGTACDDGCEQSVVVVFDLYAPTHEDAARHLAGLLGSVLHDDAVDAWWYPEPQDKHIARNDRDPMALRPIDPDPSCTHVTDVQYDHPARDHAIYGAWRD